MVISNREEFSSVIQQNGVEGLLEALRKKTTHDDSMPTEQASGAAQGGLDEGEQLGPPEAGSAQSGSAN
ncbi:MAG: hypothetical protein R3360_07115, partial [Alphaproteobacteria bacterium]|nr:hypothetical protein [Alphaproteobacteria bacterium]